MSFINFNKEGCVADFSSDVSRVYNLPGSAVALFLSIQKKPFSALELTEEAAFRLYEDVQFFRSLMKDSHPRSGKVFFLPDPDGPGFSGRRAEVVLSMGESDSLIASVQGMDAPVWSKEELARESLRFVRGSEAARESIETRLRDAGYTKVSIVVEEGEYSMKGWLLDVFPSTMETPVRIEFFGDEVEHIRSFDIETQRSLCTLEEITILPAMDPPAGLWDTSLRKTEKFFIDVPVPQEMDAEGRDAPYEVKVIFLSRFGFKGEGLDAGLLPLRGIGICHDERNSVGEIPRVIKRLSSEIKVIIISSSSGQAERMRDILFDGGVVAPFIETCDVLRYQGSVAITIGKLSSGLFMPGLLILTEKELFGERLAYRPLKRSRVSGLLSSLDDISPGDFVVHRDHGIGRFSGIRRNAGEGYESDLIVLEYTGGDLLYIPLYHIDRIKKYVAGEGAVPGLDRLGGKTWKRRKEKVRKAVREMAEGLLTLYAEREVAKGFSFSPETNIHQEFNEFFPYEETPDQLRVIDEISRDMTSDGPMERLLCGDVGYGKTEVAMRAAFKAVYDGRQVAVVVPTTILCEQHYETFKGRFSAFPVRIDFLSRFKSRRERNGTLEALAKGEIDIIIGTHGLIRKDVSFCNLGLLIIDEEHRFGVAQKERIKELKKGIDVLSMTATPIPRTLQMGLSGIRAMSLIETPPEERLAVRSIVSIFDDKLIREAIEREFQRGGQVLFVHNYVFDIERMADLLKRLIPHGKIAVAHGRMAERRLEEVMHRFMKGEYNVLLSTMIIGSGIDIPTANTIIINRADKIGLADLYQLRGRVGRSNVRAYAYFLIPGEDLVTDEARKRLQAVREMSFLGAGFRLAMKDLEIRGAGNLLGPQQSGHIHAVGFDMFIEMLEKAVAELKGIEVKEVPEPSIHLKVSALIPEDYIDDLSLRLGMYRRIANIKSFEEAEDIQAEMTDRFGAPPDEIVKLLDIMKLKILAKGLHVTILSRDDGKMKVAFSDETPVSMEVVLGLQQRFPGIRFRKDGFEVDLQGHLEDKKVLSFALEVMRGLSG
jgi:transcription-repair coupling factor (superfamily II helicase)